MRQVFTGVLAATKAARCGVVFRSRGAVLVLTILVTCPIATATRGESASDSGRLSHQAPAPFTVGARVDKLYFYPCADCHAYMDPNDKMRELDVEQGHPSKLEHGGGLMWCFSCHDSRDYGNLQNFMAEPIDFDHGYQVCSGCHSPKYLDWKHGAHGKRAANWRGERRLFSCVECHNPHQPAILPRAPEPPPPIRAGLKPMAPGEADEIGGARRPQWEHIDAR